MGGLKSVLASVALAMVGGVIAAPALADGRGGYDARPPLCPEDHDHRAHDANYYDYYAKDRYYAAGPYQPARGDGRYYGDGRYGYGRGGNWGRDRIIQRRDFPTPYRARIVLVEKVEWTRNGEYLTCNVFATGPDAEYVRNRDLRRVARNYCSRRADIRIAYTGGYGDGYGYRDGWR